jgi:hypothetical protein
MMLQYHKRLFLFPLLFLLPFSLHAQTPVWEDTASAPRNVPLPINESILFGGGGNVVSESALTPGSSIPYAGSGIRLAAERFRLRTPDSHYSTQALLLASIALTTNPAGSASEVAASVLSITALHRRFRPTPMWDILAGPSLHLAFDNVFNTRDSNNPDVFRISLALSPSVLSLYRFRLFNHPFLLRTQLEAPLLGAALAPPYGQSYYELYALGNAHRLVAFTAPHNRRSLVALLSLDFPAGPLILRLAAAGQFDRYRLHALRSHHDQYSLFIGFVRESFFFGGRTWRTGHLTQSALY